MKDFIDFFAFSVELGAKMKEAVERFGIVDVHYYVWDVPKFSIWMQEKKFFYYFGDREFTISDSCSPNHKVYSCVVGSVKFISVVQEANNEEDF